MTFKAATMVLGPALLSVALLGCSVKAPPEAAKPPFDELIEQNAALAPLSNEDLIQLLFDEMSRVHRAVVLSTSKLPSSQSIDGCLTYTPSSDGSQVFIRVDCSGRDERHDGEQMGRSLQGHEVMRSQEGGTFYGGALEVRRFRPAAPAKTLRTARLVHTIRIKPTLGAPLLLASSKSEFLGSKAEKVANAESWTANFDSKWNRQIGKPVTMTAGNPLSLVFKAESGAISRIKMVPTGEIGFARAENNECLRPIGTFAVQMSTRKSQADAEETADKKITTTSEGFLFSGSTSVIPWPMGCLENVSP